jgi:hypothetical protein
MAVHEQWRIMYGKSAGRKTDSLSKLYKNKERDSVAFLVVASTSALTEFVIKQQFQQQGFAFLFVSIEFNTCFTIWVYHGGIYRDVYSGLFTEMFTVGCLQRCLQWVVYRDVYGGLFTEMFTVGCLQRCLQLITFYHNFLGCRSVFGRCLEYSVRIFVE